MKHNALSNVDVVAVSLVNKGANRKRFFLRKSAEGEDLETDLIDLTADSSLLMKADDWSAVYCVVAEPGALEDSGVGGTAVPDRWASEDEIRKACHRFAKNGALINKMHETLDQYGVMVENAIALSDIDVDGETIRKGSWYIAIEPNEHGRDAIESGAFTGVSIEGTGMRTLVEKSSEEDELLAKVAEALDCSVQELEDMEPEAIREELVKGRRGRYDESKHRRAPSGASGGGRFASKGGARARPGAGGKNKAGRGGGGSTLAETINGTPGRMVGGNLKGKTPKGWKGKSPRLSVKAWNDQPDGQRLQRMKAFQSRGGLLGPNRMFMEDGSIISRSSHPTAFKSAAQMTPRQRQAVRASQAASKKKRNSTMKKLSELLLGTDEDAEDLAKAATFGDRMAADKLSDELPRGMDLLRSVIFSAVHGDDEDPMSVIRASTNEFCAWAESLLGSSEGIAKQQEVIGSVESTEEISKTDSEMLTPEERTELVDEIKKGVAADFAKSLGITVEESEPTMESISKAVSDLKGVEDGEELANRVGAIEASIEKLAAGDSAQSDDEPDPAAGASERKQLAKAAAEAEGINPALMEMI
jgi:hypothetical protein